MIAQSAVCTKTTWDSDNVRVPVFVSGTMCRKTTAVVSATVCCLGYRR